MDLPDVSAPRAIDWVQRRLPDGTDLRIPSDGISLVSLGVAEARLGAQGYGESNPVASNATDEGRAKNRRIAMRVTSR